MNKLGPITKYIEKILLLSGKPMTMKQIVSKVAKKFPSVTHARIWNSVHNNCVTLTPRFKEVKSGEGVKFTLAKK